MDFSLLSRAIPLLAHGAELTLLISCLGILFGLPFGLSLGLLRVSPLRPLAWAGDLYSGVLRGTPMLVQLFILYYGLPQFDFVRHNVFCWWIVGNAMHCAILAVVMNTTAFTSELFRTAFQGVPHGLLEAADSCGMPCWVKLRRITLPLAFRNVLPAYANEAVIIVKESSLASTITVLEITGVADRLMSETYAILEIFAVASVFYLAINLCAMSVIRFIEHRISAYER